MHLRLRSSVLTQLDPVHIWNLAFYFHNSTLCTVNIDFSTLVILKLPWPLYERRTSIREAYAMHTKNDARRSQTSLATVMYL